MFVEIFIALSCVLIQPTIHHFIGNFDECTASKVCNHTWTPVCGHLEAESRYRLFLDDCDLHEYNCDNNATYVEVDTKICSTNCTQRDQPVTPPMTAEINIPKVSTIMTTEEIKTETTKITSTKEVTETTKDKTDTSTIFVAPTTLEMTTEEPKTTNKQTSEITTKVTATTTEATVITNFTPSDVTTVKPVNETTTTTELPPISNESYINDDKNTIPEETTRLTSVATSATLKLDCYGKRCSMPSTWETTPVGETRDFVQILRERYGDRIKFLRDTTHFPKQPTYARKSAFIPGNHMEMQKQQYYETQLEKW